MDGSGFDSWVQFASYWFLIITSQFQRMGESEQFLLIASVPNIAEVTGKLILACSE